MASQNCKHTSKKPNKHVKLSESTNECRPILTPSDLNLIEVSEPATERERLASNSKTNNNIDMKGTRYESKIIYYVSKLRNCWYKAIPEDPNAISVPEHCGKTAKDHLVRHNSRNEQEKVNSNVMKPMLPCPDRYSSSKVFLNRPVQHLRMATTNKKLQPLHKAENIVYAAIDYGLANGILSKKGKYFWLNNENRDENKLPKRSFNEKSADKQLRAVKRTDEKLKEKIAKKRKLGVSYSSTSVTTTDSLPSPNRRCNCKECRKNENKLQRRSLTPGIALKHYSNDQFNDVATPQININDNNEVNPTEVSVNNINPSASQAQLDRDMTPNLVQTSSFNEKSAGQQLNLKPTEMKARKS